MVRLPLFQSSPKTPDWPGRCFAASAVNSACSAAAPPKTTSIHHLNMSPTADSLRSMPKNAGKARVERSQEFLVRKAAPIVGVEGLVTGGADTSFDQSRIDDTSEDGGDPVGKLDPREGSAERFGSDIQTAPELGPEPFRRVDPAAFRNVPGAKLCAEFGDFGGLAPTGVILPQPALRVEVVLPFGARRQRLILVVNRNWAGPGCVDADSDNLRSVEIRFA